jgi:hypothetical protein
MPINFAVKLIATVAIEALQVGLQASKHTYGPRLSETQITTAEYGTPLPRLLGERRVSGQIVWSKDLDIVDHTTKAKGGGKQTNQSALWTGGVALTDCRGSVGPLDKVLKIWLDETLAYDATGTGPISYSSSLGIDLAAVMRIYYGTDDQAVDPAYADYCEGRYGPDSATAFRGTGMLVFDRLPLDNFGNRPPQISALVVSAAADAYPYEELTTQQNTSAGFAFSPSGNWMAYWVNGHIEWWDIATRTNIGFSPSAGTAAGFPNNMSLSKDGTAWFFGDVLDGLGVDKKLFSVTPGGAPVGILSDTANNFPDITRALDRADGSVTVLTTFESRAGYLDQGFEVPTVDSMRDACIDDDDTVWQLFQPTGASSSFSIVNYATGTGTSFTGTSRSDVSSARICFCASTQSFFVYTDGHFYIIDKATMAVTSSGAAGWSGVPSLPAQSPERSSFWVGFSEYSLADGSLIRTLDQDSWVSPSSYGSKAFDPVNNAIWARKSTGSILRVLYVDRVSNAGTTDGAIVSAMCADAGLLDRDTALLTHPVAGYSWTRGDVKSQMEPVLDINDSDACPHDFTLKFRPRGSSPAGTIATADFAKNGDNARYKITEKQDTDLPKILRVNFADTQFDQETNNVLSPLPVDAVDCQRDATLDLTTYADTPDGAQQKADRYMRRTWNGKDGLESSLTAQELAIEPGDVKTVNLDGIEWNVRLDKQTFVGGRIDCTWVRDEPGIATLNSSTAGPVMGARDPEVIVIPAPVRGFIIDAPYREDSDQDVRPSLYSGAGAYGGLAFPGATIWEESGVGTGAAYDQLLATVSSGATWGICTTTLADVPSPWLWDRGNTLTVTLQSGSLTSVTEADIDADPTLNLILVGQQGAWEYVNFTTATLVSGSTYTLSGFKRGRRGTEWACSGHTSGEAFVLASALDVDELGSDDIGDSLSFKAQSLGRSLDSVPAIASTRSLLRRSSPMRRRASRGRMMEPTSPPRLLGARAWAAHGSAEQQFRSMKPARRTRSTFTTAQP